MRSVPTLESKPISTSVCVFQKLKARGSEPQNSRDQNQEIRTWHRYSAWGVANNGCNQPLTQSSVCRGTISAIVPIFNSEHRFQCLDERSDRRKWMNSVRSKTPHRTVECSTYPHSTSYTPGPTSLNSAFQIDVGYSSVASRIASTNCDIFLAPEDGTAELTFPVIALRQIIGKVSDNKRKKSKMEENRKSKFKNGVVNKICVVKEKKTMSELTQVSSYIRNNRPAT